MAHENKITKLDHVDAHDYPTYTATTQYGELEIRPEGGGRITVRTGYTGEGRHRAPIQISRVPYDGTIGLTNGRTEKDRDYRGDLPSDVGNWRCRYNSGYFGFGRSDWDSNPNAHYGAISDNARARVHAIAEELAVQLITEFPDALHAADLVRLRRELRGADGAVVDARKSLGTAQDKVNRIEAELFKALGQKAVRA